MQSSMVRCRGCSGRGKFCSPVCPLGTGKSEGIKVRLLRHPWFAWLSSRQEAAIAAEVQLVSAQFGSNCSERAQYCTNRWHLHLPRSETDCSCSNHLSLSLCARQYLGSLQFESSCHRPGSYRLLQARFAMISFVVFGSV